MFSDKCDDSDDDDDHDDEYGRLQDFLQECAMRGL